MTSDAAIAPGLTVGSPGLTVGWCVAGTHTLTAAAARVGRAVQVESSSEASPLSPTLLAFSERFLELLIDLLSQLPTRRFFKAVLQVGSKPGQLSPTTAPCHPVRLVSSIHVHPLTLVRQCPAPGHARGRASVVELAPWPVAAGVAAAGHVQVLPDLRDPRAHGPAPHRPGHGRAALRQGKPHTQHSPCTMLCPHARQKDSDSPVSRPPHPPPSHSAAYASDEVLSVSMTVLRLAGAPAPAPGVQVLP